MSSGEISIKLDWNEKYHKNRIHPSLFMIAPILINHNGYF